MKNTRKGFTLVELLAVIVILAIIMIIAIPAVLQTMNLARQKTFKEYITKVYTGAQTYQVAQAAAGVANKGASYTVVRTTGDKSTCYVYDIKNIGLSSVGDYKGTVVICENVTSVDANSNVYIGLKDSNYSTKGLYNYTKVGEMPVDKLGTNPDGDGKVEFVTGVAADNLTEAGLDTADTRHKTGDLQSVAHN